MKRSFELFLKYFINKKIWFFVSFGNVHETLKKLYKPGNIWFRVTDRKSQEEIRLEKNSGVQEKIVVIL